MEPKNFEFLGLGFGPKPKPCSASNSLQMVYVSLTFTIEKNKNFWVEDLGLWSSFLNFRDFYTKKNKKMLPENCSYFCLFKKKNRKTIFFRNLWNYIKL